MSKECWEEFRKSQAKLIDTLLMFETKNDQVTSAYIAKGDRKTEILENVTLNIGQLDSTLEKCNANLKDAKQKAEKRSTSF